LNLIGTGILKAFTCQQLISDNEDGREKTGKIHSQAKLGNFYIFKSPSQCIPAAGGKRKYRMVNLYSYFNSNIWVSGEKKLHSLPLLANVNSFAESLNTICLEIQNFLLHSGAARGKCTVLSAKP